MRKPYFALEAYAWIGYFLDMGKVIVKIKLTNNFELELKRRNKLRKDKPRSVEAEALVDTGD